jgi:hypothetical protein
LSDGLCGLVKQLYRPVWAGEATIEPGKMLVGKLVASWLQHGSANSSAITHSLFPFIRLLQRTKLYDNEKSRAKAAFQATFSAATARRTAKVHAEGKIWRRQANFFRCCADHDVKMMRCRP